MSRRELVQFRVWATVTVAVREGRNTQTKTSRTNGVVIRAADATAAMRIAERNLVQEMTERHAPPKGKP